MMYTRIALSYTKVEKPASQYSAAAIVLHWLTALLLVTGFTLPFHGRTVVQPA